MPSLLVTLFLVAHGLIHASFVSPRPPATPGGPQWPFELASSWLLGPVGLDEGATRAIGMALVLVVLAGYVVAALAVAGLLPGSLFVPGVVGGSAGSIVLLALFFHPWLVLGFAIDAALLWAVLVGTWRPGSAAL